MAKISPASIKYSISADFQSEGPVEKPDVIGALFGQTEGLLGSDMELRELQKEGKIGRIDVELTSENGKTKGEIIIPSALDKTETTIIAASIETIDKIGPTDAKITIREIEDVRGGKRDYIMDRAKKLLSQIQGDSMNMDEMGQELNESQRTDKIVNYGDEKLPAGPKVDESEDVIVVEGRADVVNLLKNNISNVIGMTGTKLPAMIAELGAKKELTLFVDGDRGGKLIAKNVCDNARVAFITSAPDGKEVEELTGKEILQALRKKVVPAEFFQKNGMKPSSSVVEVVEEETKVSDKELSKEDKAKLRKLEDKLSGKNILALDEALEIIKDMPSSKIGYTKIDSAYVLMTKDATGKIVEFAESLKAKYVAAKSFGKVDSSSVEFISL
jgi:DNA primase